MLRDSEKNSTSLPGSVYGLTTLLVGLMGICFIVEILAWQVFYLRFQPYARPLSEEHSPDFISFWGRFQFFHSAGFFSYRNGDPFMYPAPVAVVYKLFYLVPSRPLLAFLLSGCTAFLLASLWTTRRLLRRGISLRDSIAFPLVILLCSYPVWFAVKQANMEIVIWVVITAGLGLFLSGRGYSAAACFGLAAAMKIFPFVYFGLLLSRRQYRQIAFGVMVILVTTVVSLWLVDPDIRSSWQNVSIGLNTFRWLYMLHIRPEIGVDHSLFALIKLMIRPIPTFVELNHLLTLYLGTVALLGVALFFLRINRLPILNQILSLTVASVLLPPTSFEYTLLHLLLPLALLVFVVVDASRDGYIPPVLRVVLGCFGVLLSFIPELIHHELRCGGQVKCVVLLVLFGLVLWYPFGPLLLEKSWDRSQETVA